MKLSVTRLKLFEACRMAYRFKYMEGLEPVQKADALQIGENYHKLIERLYREGNLYQADNDNSKELAMACAYEKYIYPKFHVKQVEEWFEYPVDEKNMLVGRVDGIADDGHLVEHKTTSEDDFEKYEFDLQWDEQILAYMLGYGVRKMWYTVIRKPAIRQKKTETDEEFFDRMVAWYDDDTENKIRVIEITRTDEEVEEFRKHLQALMGIIENAESEEGAIYRNTMHCNCWGRRCEYSNICLNYDPQQEYIDFIKNKKEEENYGV